MVLEIHKTGDGESGFDSYLGDELTKLGNNTDVEYWLCHDDAQMELDGSQNFPLI